MRLRPATRRHAPVPALLLAVLAGGCDRGAPPPAAERPATTSPAAPATAAPATATAEVRGDGIAGTLALAAAPDGVHVTGQLAGLAPDSDHGFHVHEKGDCSAFATGSAGPHLNPGHQPHGPPDGPAHHAGDLPFLHADSSGQATVDVRIPGAGLGTGDARDLRGRALVVHEKVDDYSTQP
jgi:Cu-Zn family superoxide dismutase